ncbi:Gem-associated protein 5 [Liparis tanakae]|uniref:Gem-associated protein 5 n=1 Tax=Liparis tanakae TaxID=230148 RepID=A0A4Z2E4I3_9TELE|nr:Gem-associated protein 5 [Liparis tanakae]
MSLAMSSPSLAPPSEPRPPLCPRPSLSHLAAGASFDAAKVIARKNDVPSLRAAASVARISGEVALARSLALRCAKDLVAAQDWITAQEVLSSQDSLLVHRLHLCVAELLTAPGASWASTGELRLQDRVRDTWETRFGVSPSSEGHRGAAVLLQELTLAESPTPTANIPLRQVRFQTGAVCVSRTSDGVPTVMGKLDKSRNFKMLISRPGKVMEKT